MMSNKIKGSVQHPGEGSDIAQFARRDAALGFLLRRDGMTVSYDSKQETTEHILRVRELLYIVQNRLEARGFAHDQSKLGPNEKPLFDRVTGTLRGLTYGSPEYKASIAELGPALKHHYENNSHHPEHVKLWKCPLCKGVFSDDKTTPSQVYESKPRFCPFCCPHGTMFEATLEPHVSVDGMSLLDVLEMLCDWKAAGERHADGSIERSLSVNKARFNISPQLHAILENTARELGWLTTPNHHAEEGK
jgi:hypothetical protein